jgi:DNA polymerase-3 subunit epsilon
LAKAKISKKRVAQHFKITGKKSKEVEFKNNIAKITYKETGNELAALLWECQQIKELNPPFNRALNKRRFPYAIEPFYDQEDFVKLKLVSVGEHDEHRYRVGSKKGGKTTIDRIVGHALGLDPKEVLTFENQVELFKRTLGQEVYNQKILDELAKLDYPDGEIVIELAGRKAEEQCLVYIQDGNLTHMDYQDDNGLVETLQLDENKDTRKILLQFIKKNPAKIKKGPGQRAFF